MGFLTNIFGSDFLRIHIKKHTQKTIKTSVVQQNHIPFFWYPLSLNLNLLRRRSSPAKRETSASAFCHEGAVRRSGKLQPLTINDLKNVLSKMNQQVPAGKNQTVSTGQRGPDFVSGLRPIGVVFLETPVAAHESMPATRCS